MTTSNTQKREAAMFWEGFVRAVPPRELSQTHASANETNKTVFYMLYLYWNVGRFNYDMLIQGHGVEAEIWLLSIRNLRAGRGGFSAPHPDIITPSPEKDSVPILQESGWVSLLLSGGHGIFYIHRESISQPSRTWWFTLPTALSWTHVLIYNTQYFSQ
jgi:hypothetical protein